MSGTRSAYDTVAASYAERVGTTLGGSAEHPSDVARVDAVVAIVRSSGRPLLDAGCGPGRVAARALRLGVPAVGVDLAPRMLAAGRRADPRLRLAAGDLAALPLRSDSCAGAVAWYSLIHLPPEALPTALRELARVVVDGGPLLVAFQTGAGQERRRGTAYGHAVDLTSWRHDPRHVLGCLRDAGWAGGRCDVRAPALPHEDTAQAFVTARRLPR